MHWYIVAGLVLVAMALAGTLVKRLPLTASLLYLGVGVALGMAGMIRIDPLRWARLLERVTELAVLISLFTAGLKMRVPPRDGRWWVPVRLASLSMAVTIGLVALAGVYVLGLPWGAAVLLGAILAPTDPVLASDVQVEHPFDPDRLRFGLTGEAGLNDGSAFAFVMLGLGLMGLHELGGAGWRWFAIDVAWAVLGGLLVGALAGTFVSRFVLYLRRKHREAVGLDEFLSLGLLALAYGVALWVHTYGFLAAFAAGVALRREEARRCDESGRPPADVMAAASGASPADKAEVAADPRKGPAYMAQAVLGWNEQLERVAEVAVVILIGGLLAGGYWRWEGLGLAAALFLVIRPAAVLLGLAGAGVGGVRRGLIAWFGIRGVGSVYYLAYAIHKGVDGETARRLTGLTLTVVATSIAVHGVSVTPLMKAYERWREARRSRSARRREPAASDGEEEHPVPS